MKDSWAFGILAIVLCLAGAVLAGFAVKSATRYRAPGITETTSGFIGCAPPEITIEEVYSDGRAWIARCKDRTAYCSRLPSGDVVCSVEVRRAAEEHAERPL